MSSRLMCFKLLASLRHPRESEKSGKRNAHLLYSAELDACVALAEKQPSNSQTRLLAGREPGRRSKPQLLIHYLCGRGPAKAPSDTQKAQTKMNL